jgi:hypothetical protein
MQAFAQLSDADPGQIVAGGTRAVLAKKFGVQLAHLRQRTPFTLIIDLARVGLLELGGQVAIDLKADADFHERGGCPNHETFLRFSIVAYDSNRSVR